MTDGFETGELTAADGTPLHYRALSLGEPRATVLLLHGYGEHCARYDHIQRWLHERGLSSLAFDCRGHGRSGGRRGHVDRFEDYLEDLDRVLHLVRSRVTGGGPLFLVAHSHGGLIATSYLLQKPEAVDGLVLSSPYLGLKVEVPAAKVALARLLAGIWPTLALPTGLPAEHLSTDPAVAAAYDEDPLVNDAATARWFVESTRQQREVLAQAEQLTLPLLLLQAGDDRIASPEASRSLFDAAGSQDKEVRWYDGLYHELFNERERERVLQDLERWLLARLG